MSQINIYLARHGETLFNKKNYIQGLCDAPLTPSGLEGAENLGEALKSIQFDLAISSHLTRAITTKNIILDKNLYNTVPKEIDPGFAEFNFGVYEGDYGGDFWDDMGKKHHLDFNEIQKESLFKKFSYVYDPIENPIAEKGDDFRNRIETAIYDLIKTAKENKLTNILVVSHGIVLMSLVEIFVPDNEFKGFMANSSVSKLVVNEDEIGFEYIAQRENLI